MGSFGEAFPKLKQLWGIERRDWDISCGPGQVQGCSLPGAPALSLPGAGEPVLGTVGQLWLAWTPGAAFLLGFAWFGWV